jgi:hypothetical protein
LETLAYVLSETDLVVLPTVLLGSSPAEQKLLSDVAELTSVDHYESAITSAFAARNYEQATSLLGYFLRNIQGDEEQLRRYASLYYLSKALAGTLSENDLLPNEINPNFQVSESFVEWMEQDFL